MSIQRLTELMPAPSKGLEIPTVSDWAIIESQLGKLPSDYRAFIGSFGTGLIDNFLWVFSPCASNEFVNIASQASVILNGLAESARTFPDLFTLLRHPAPGGFLPFGSTDNGDNLFWVTKGEPDSWTVAVMGPRSAECYYHNGGMSDFLCNLLERKIHCSIFPDDFPSTSRRFEFHARLY